MLSNIRLCPFSYIDYIHIEKTENFNFLEALTSNVDLLDNILSYLRYADLRNCAQLNEIWADRVEAVLKKRLAPTVFSLPSYYCYQEEVSATPALCFLFMSNECYGNDEPLKLDTYLCSPPCIHRQIPQVKKPVIEIIENDILGFSKCPMVALSCRTVSSSFNGSSTRANGAIFPIIPNVKMSVFRLKKDQRNGFAEIVDKNIGENNKLECLLAFSVNPKKNILKRLIKHLKENRPTDNFAFGGGFVQGMQAFNYVPKKSTSDSIYKKEEILCATFSTPRDMEVPFDAYSIVIPSNINTKEAIDEYLSDLKDNHIPRKYGIVYQITCVSRDKRDIPITIESVLKMCPYVEIVGFTGDGEIGWNYYKTKRENLEKNSEPEEKRSKVIMKLFHELTTVLVFITWGKERKA